MSRPLATLKIIAAASGLGAPDQRCGRGPEVLARHLAQQPDGLLIQAILKPSAGKGLAALAPFLDQLAESVATLLKQAPRIAVVGGDHSCAIGTWRGVAAALAAPIGLVWVDAHMDAHTPVSSPSGHWHGMPVAALLGHGDPRLLAPDGAVIAPSNLCLLGVRSYEGPEAELLQRLGVRVISMAEVQRLGFERALAEAVAIAKQGTAAYGISVDLDGLDPADAPGVGSPVVGGIAAADLLAGLRRLSADPQLRLLELAEFNPVLDVERRTLRLVVQILNEIRGEANESDD